MEKYFQSYIRTYHRQKGTMYQARVKYINEKGQRDETTQMLPLGTGKREAKRLAEEWRAELNRQADNAPSITKDKTVEEIVTNYLHSQEARGEIEKSTLRQELNDMRNYITPYLGNYGFYGMTRDSIMNWLTQLNQDGFSQNTICGAFYLLRKVYRYYVDIGELRRNPFDGVKSPKKGRGKVTHLTEEQMKQFVDAVNEDFTPIDREYIAFMLAFYTGLRRAEISALRWRDVNLKDGIISVESSIGEAKGGAYTKQPKTNSSIRKFKMVPQIQEILANRYALVNPQPNYFVTGKGVKFYNPRLFGKDFREWADKHNLVDAYDNPITIHGLRHNFASVGIQSKMDIASLSRMLGHSSRAMTLDIYGDDSEDAMIKASEKLGNKFK